MITSTVVVKKQQNIFIVVVIIQDRNITSDLHYNIGDWGVV